MTRGQMTAVALGVGAVVLYLATRRKTASANPFAGSVTRGSFVLNPFAGSVTRGSFVLNPRDGGASIVSTFGPSRGMVLPNAAAAQRETELYGYGSGS